MKGPVAHCGCWGCHAESLSLSLHCRAADIVLIKRVQLADYATSQRTLHTLRLAFVLTGFEERHAHTR